MEYNKNQKAVQNSPVSDAEGASDSSRNSIKSCENLEKSKRDFNEKDSMENQQCSSSAQELSSNNSRRYHRRHRPLYKKAGFYGFLIGCLGIGYGCWWMLNFPLLPTMVMAALFAVEALLFFLLWYFLIHRHRKTMKAIGWFFCAISVATNACGGFLLQSTYQTIQSMNRPTSIPVIYSSSDADSAVYDSESSVNGNYAGLYVLTDSVIDSVNDMNGRKTGYLTTMDEEQTQAVKDAVQSEEIELEYIPYTSAVAMVLDLKGAVIDGMILYQPLISVLEDQESLDNLHNQIRALLLAPCESTELPEAKKVDVTNTPFSVLISGIDTYGEIGTAGRSDVNILITVNPTTRQILLINIPRDYYVDVSCGEKACAVGGKDKLTHTGVRGLESTKSTIEKLLGTSIEYTMQVNFDSVIKIVDALEYVTVVSPQEFDADGYHFQAGTNQMDGEMALAFSRERYTFAAGDRERGKNQMRVIQGIIGRILSPSILKNYLPLLNAVSSSIRMNLTANDIASLVKMQLERPSSWRITQFSLDGSNGNEYLPILGNNAYVMLPDQKTIDQAKEDIEAIKKGENPPYSNSSNE